jgi:hypothetical protein
MELSTILFGALFVLYIPVQLAFLVTGIWLLVKSQKKWGKIIGGIACLMLFALMLPFTRVIGSLLYIWITDGSFSA